MTDGPSFALPPAAIVEAVEVILPAEVKAASFGVIGIILDVVVAGEPRHVPVVEVVAPTSVGGRPEVHANVLGLVLPLHFRGTTVHPANLVAVE